jgi:hypothetical protein
VGPHSGLAHCAILTIIGLLISYVMDAPRIMREKELLALEGTARNTSPPSQACGRAPGQRNVSK